MSAPSAATSYLTWALAIAGAVAILGATLAAARARAGSPGQGGVPEGEPRAGGFAWIVIASLAYAIPALAAALGRPDSDGLRAAVVQMGSVFLAAALGVVSLGGGHPEEGPRSRLASLGVAVAWLSLLGLPPALGFHGKLLVYRSLLQADWGWLTVVAMAGTVGALVPAFRALALPVRGDITRSRAVLIALLVAAVGLLGLFPQAVLSFAALLTGSG